MLTTHATFKINELKTVKANKITLHITYNQKWLKTFEMKLYRIRKSKN